MANVKKVVDYLVLGAGSAGCVLTNRLLNHAKSPTVALLEAGTFDVGKLNSWQIHMPAALTYSVASDQYNWNYYTVPQQHLDNRVLHAPRGKVLGGSSSINAMVYIRGHALDFQRWAEQEGCETWSYANVLPYFKKAQQHTSKGALEADENDYRGKDGPLKTTSYPYGCRHHEMFDVFEAAGEQAGYQRTKDVNGYRQEGFGPFDMTVDSTRGVRSSTAQAYLHPILKDSSSGVKKNLSLFTSTMARRIIFDEEDKSKAIGVECEDLNTGEVFEVRARQEVILSLGAVGSPQLLNLSGIGDTTDLERIQNSSAPVVVSHLPDVGKNLQDHLEIYLQYLNSQNSSIYPIADWDFSNPRHVLQRCFIGLQWFATGQGICSSNLFESGAFFRSRKGIKHPDIQLHFIPAIIHGQLEVFKQHGFQIHAGTLRPSSRGKLITQSLDPKQTPLIDPNYFQTEQDIVDMRAAVRLSDELVTQPAFKSFFKSKFGDFAQVDLTNDAELDQWIKQHSESAYHLSCTCAMGKVVDETGKVFGTKHLRVVDASIMPSMTSGNLNSPTIMIAEKIGDHILGVPPLKPEHRDYYVPEHWTEKQR